MNFQGRRKVFWIGGWGGDSQASSGDALCVGGSRGILLQKTLKSWSSEMLLSLFHFLFFAWNGSGRRGGGVVKLYYTVDSDLSSVKRCLHFEHGMGMVVHEKIPACVAYKHVQLKPPLRVKTLSWNLYTTAMQLKLALHFVRWSDSWNFFELWLRDRFHEM